MDWDNTTETVISKKDKTEIKLTIGNITAYVNGKERSLAVPGKIINGHTYIPAKIRWRISRMHGILGRKHKFDQYQ